MKNSEMYKYSSPETRFTLTEPGLAVLCEGATIPPCVCMCVCVQFVCVCCEYTAWGKGSVEKPRIM